MPAISDEKLARWASSPPDSEKTKAENAERAIKKAIAASSALACRDIKVFAQGSYRNRTNVRADSDVDVCVMCRDTYFFDIPPGRVISEFEPNFSSATYTFQQYKSDVGAALLAYFGAAAVTAGQKAFDIHENTYRIAADAVPCFEYHWYGYTPPAMGTAFMAGGSRIFNYPEHATGTECTPLEAPGASRTSRVIAYRVSYLGISQGRGAAD